MVHRSVCAEVNRHDVEIPTWLPSLPIQLNNALFTLQVRV